MTLEYLKRPDSDTYVVKQNGTTIGLITKGRFYAQPLAYSLAEMAAIAEFMESLT